VDRGFFKLLCDLMRRLERHLFRFPDAAIARQAGFFVTTVLGGLEHCGGHVTEPQAMLLLQVRGCFKCFFFFFYLTAKGLANIMTN
jgi:hypothetical protein